jgi:excisionase family DNA binding protein
VVDDEHALNLDPRLEAALTQVLEDHWGSEPPEDFGKVVPLHGGGAAAVAADVGTGPEVPTLLLTVEEAAKMLRCGRTMVSGLISSNELRTVKIGALRRVALADVEEYVDRKVAEVPPTAWSAPGRTRRAGKSSGLPPNWPTTRVSER